MSQEESYKAEYGPVHGPLVLSAVKRCAQAGSALAQLRKKQADPDKIREAEGRLAVAKDELAEAKDLAQVAGLT